MQNRFGRLLCLLLLCCLAATTSVACADDGFDGLAVEVLNVGQSDCTLITVDGLVLMIDSGTVAERHTVQAALAARNIERIDYLLLTHPHEDHIGNARMLLETYTVGALIVPPVETDDLGYRLVMEAAAQCAVTVQTVVAGNAFSLGRAEARVLYAGDNAEDPNNASIVLRVTFGETRFLFTGDNEKESELALLETLPAEELDCDFLKAGHHGSDNATSAELLAAVTPQYVAISCGADNTYGFPHGDMLKRLERVGAVWHRTDTAGDLRYVSDGQSVIYEE